MVFRSLIFLSVLVGLTVAPPPGPPGGSFGGQGGSGGGGGGGGGSGGPPPPPMHGSSQGDNRRPGSGTAESSFDFGASSSGGPSGSFSEGMAVPSQQNQQQPFQFGFSSEGQNQDGQNQPGKQGFYQFRPQDGTNNQQGLNVQASGSQAFPQSSQPQPYVQYQSSASAFPSAQQNAMESMWQQHAQQVQHLGGGYSNSIPGYGYSSSPSFTSYMPQTGAMGYLPSMYNHVPMVVAASHDFTPFSTGYSGYPVGVSTQVYPQTLYSNQGYGTQGYGTQGYGVAPTGTTQGQYYTQAQAAPNTQGTYFYNSMPSTQSQASNQKLPQVLAQNSGKVQTSQ